MCCATLAQHSRCSKYVGVTGLQTSRIAVINVTGVTGRVLIAGKWNSFGMVHATAILTEPEEDMALGAQTVRGIIVPNG